MKVFLIGLDGATWDLLKPWIDDDRLPTIKKIVERGSYGVLKSTIPTNSFPAIPSLVTGKNPAKLGIFDFRGKDGSLITSKYINQTIWEMLNEYGYKTCIVNVTGTYPPKKIYGALVTGLLTPSPNSEFTYPKEIKEEIKYFHPEKWPSEIGLTKPGKEKELLEYVLNIAKQKYKGLRTVLSEDSFDFIMYWIYETDEVQHYLWHRKDLLLKFYKWIDKILDDLLHDFNDYTFFIVSDHGFSASPKYRFYVNTWLMSEGYLVLKNRIISYLWNKLQSFVVNHLTLAQIQKISSFFNKKSKNNEEVLGYPTFIKFRKDINWKKTKAIQELNGIFIIKENVENYEMLRTEIIDKLKKLQIAGEKVVKEIWKREEIYTGQYADETPDIIFLLNDKFIANSTISKDIYKPYRDRLSGGHHYARDGIIMAYGECIKEGYQLSYAEILDIAPTILYAFGVSIPSDIDGRVLIDIFKKDFTERKMKLKDEKAKVKEKIRKLRRADKI